MSCDDTVLKMRRLVKHDARHPFHVRLIHTAQYIIQYQNFLARGVHLGERIKDAQPQRITQQAFSLRLRTLPAKLFLKVLLAVLPQHIWYEADPQAHDQRGWTQILEAVPAGGLLLFDLGVYQFQRLCAVDGSAGYLSHARQTEFVLYARTEFAPYGRGA